MAQTVQFQIKRGLSANIASAERVQGCWYLTTDTNEVYICQDGQTLAPLTAGGVVTYSSTRELPLVGKENIVYFIVDNSGTSIYRWTNEGAKYNRVLDSTLTINVIHGGSSSTPELD